MNCPACGTPTVDGARFCFNCGTALPWATPAEAEAERRFVTVLFGDLSDFTSWSEDLDPERVGVVTDRVLATLTAAVAEFGGHVDKLTGDGLMAVFGAPVAHEDDAERAVRAAARMQQAVRRVVEEESGGGRRLGLRVGLNTGEVLAGVQAHLSYTVVGDTVNTASRLSDAAGVGAVLAGRETAVATMSVASWRALPPLRLKGKREPVPAFELVSLRPHGVTRLGLGDEAPFLGREAEFGLLVSRVLDVADAGRPRAVLVSGEAGVGKTRLAEEITRFVGELPGARVLWGRCAPYGEGRDLAAVADMVRTACGVDEDDEPETARTRVARTVARLADLADAPPLPRGMVERLQALLGLEQVPLAGPRESGAPGTGASGDQLRQAVAALFTALSREGPLLLVIDDLHWATDLTLRGIVDVARRVSGPVLLLGVGRPDMLGFRLGDELWTDRLSDGLPESELLPVLPLDDSAADRLLRAYLGTPGEEVDPGVREPLLERAQGNPFFLTELLNLLVDRGLLQRVGDRWVLDGDLPDDVLPAGVQALLAARIDGLDGAAKGVLRDASVLGLRVTLPGLQAVGRASGHGDPDVVRKAVDTLVERRLLEPTGRESADEASYRFVHTLVRDVAYAGLAKAERARRHAAAAHFAAGQAHSVEADTMAASQGERAVALAAEMGLPRDDAAWTGRGAAFPALARLGNEALARDDNVAAEQMLQRALALTSGAEALPDDLVIPVQVARGRALAAQHRLDEAEQDVTPALQCPEPGVRADALLVLGEVRRKRGDHAGSISAFVRALAAAGEAGLDRLTGEALRQLGLVDYLDGRLRSAEERFRQAHELATRVRDRRGAAWALQHLAWSATTRGDYDLADETLEQAADLFAALEDSGGLAWVAGTEGFVRLLQGRHREAREVAGSVFPATKAVGERWGLGALLTIDAIAAAELGDIETAVSESQAARHTFARLHDEWGESLAAIAQGVAARGADEPGQAVELLDQAVELSERGGHPAITSLALVIRGYAELDRNQLDGAEESAFRGAALLQGLDLEPHAALGAKVLLAQVLRARGELERALAELDAALAVTDRPALLFPLRQALAHRAGTLLELGRRAEALDTARRAMEVPAEDVRSQVIALRALAAALYVNGEPDEANAAASQALEVARSTGQRSEIAATERLLASVAS